MNEELQWCFAKSLAGHDKETVYIIKNSFFADVFILPSHG